MIAKAFSFVQFPILPLMKAVDANDSAPVQMFRRNPKLCTPSDFDYSPYFEIIKYPFVGFTHGQDYHLLPWHGTGELESDEAGLYIDPTLQPTSDAVDDAIGRALEGLDMPPPAFDQAAVDTSDAVSPYRPDTAGRAGDGAANEGPATS